MKKNKIWVNYLIKSTSLGLFLTFSITLNSQKNSIARVWNEVILECIRNDFARPTVHARNLFHLSAGIYDAWAIIEGKSKTYFLNNTIHGFNIPYQKTKYTGNKESNMEVAISYVAFRILNHRYEVSPGYAKSKVLIDETFSSLGYDPNFTSINYQSGNPAALGNYIAKRIIDYGWQDGSNEEYFYTNLNYKPVNKPLLLKNSGINGINDINRWQPLAFEKFVDQAGNELAGNVPEFLGPEWGKVLPFGLRKADLKILKRDGENYPVYFDPGSPPMFLDSEGNLNDAFVWNHSLVSIWGSHLNPDDQVVWDISPGGIGNLNFDEIACDLESLKKMYNINGGDHSPGHPYNPFTGKPYKKNLAFRGDYTRVIAEFWADGPDSETPPGHWFTILNYVSDHPSFEIKFEGINSMDRLEWDIKSYFILGGAMHDAAISAWSIKGFYDYVRPITAIRYMAGLGQSSDSNLPNYHPNGIKLVKGFIELVGKDDSLSGEKNRNVSKIKLYTWRGHDYIKDTDTGGNYAKSGWILSDNWWPYQRPTFVTPNFAGYVSGHSTYSRAAAEVLTLLTGCEYFPGGLGGFNASKNEFLFFEEGPNKDVHIQWATYRDASNQCSLSRIWGGIHPPVDDLPGRHIGEKIGINAFHYGVTFFKK